MNPISSTNTISPQLLLTISGMHFYKFTLAIAAAFAGLSTAAVLDIAKRDAALAVTLSAIDNAVFKASVKNVGTTDLKLLAYGTLFDTAPVEKLNVVSSGRFITC
jgi:hypothetical protein